MAINQNHLFEDLDGVKCAIVEKNASAKRVAFLRPLLEWNRYTVIVVLSPPPKAAPAPPAPAPANPAPANPSSEVAPAVAAPAPAPDSPSTPSSAPPPVPVAPVPVPPPLPETFTVGVTDTMFNPTNAIFGRLLHTPDGHIVTLAYWQETEKESHDEIPYFDTGKQG